METPILAMTRPQKAEAGLSPATAAGRNMRLLVQLRWIAVGGQLLTILAVHFGMGVALPLAPMLAVVAVSALANHYARIMLYQQPIGQTAILLALLFDVMALALQLHFSGGAANPFISLFFLQLVLGAILLDFSLLGVLAAVAIMAFGMLSIFSAPLAYPVELAPYALRLERLGAWISFALTGGLLTIFIARITRNLSAREVYLAKLRRQAVEEDGIVRMGLLASGAAHELGTPLSSLAVILNDWSRMPRVARDPDLAPELAEMQREVGRCKTIVSDILHSAGAPRGEIIEARKADAFLARIAAAWRPTHPATPLDYRSEGLENATIVAEPALPQVIASLLDNAAEASPSGIGLFGARTPDGLEIAVTDTGPGFTNDQLATLGKPYQSSKGAGRGLGLFLAAALARRMGGRLAAANGLGGGAVVRLVLPLALDRPPET